jgi:hypothetical protein
MFWEVEHATLYKPGPALRGVQHSLKLQTRYSEVIQALEAIEREVEIQVRSVPRKSERC